MKDVFLDKQKMHLIREMIDNEWWMNYLDPFPFILLLLLPSPSFSFLREEEEEEEEELVWYGMVWYGMVVLLELPMTLMKLLTILIQIQILTLHFSFQSKEFIHSGIQAFK